MTKLLVDAKARLPRLLTEARNDEIGREWGLAMTRKGKSGASQ